MIEDNYYLVEKGNEFEICSSVKNSQNSVVPKLYATIELSDEMVFVDTGMKRKTWSFSQVQPLYSIHKYWKVKALKEGVGHMKVSIQEPDDQESYYEINTIIEITSINSPNPIL